MIDPFNELEIVKIKGENTTDSIGRFLRRARWIARKNDFSLHIIAHPTKLEKDRKSHKYPVARPYDIDSSAHWYNKSDNCFSIYREYKKDIVQLHIQKIKYKWQGYVGVVQLAYDRVTGCLTEYYNEDTPEAEDVPELSTGEEDGSW